MALRSPLARAAQQPYKVRSIYLKVRPAPTSLSERRAVLHALQEHGKIDVFKKLRDASSFITVTETRAVAYSIIHRSPLQFDYVSDLPTNDASNLRPLGVEAASGEDDKIDAAAALKKTFVVEVFPAPDYDHKTYIRQSPLHGPWPDERGPLNQDSLTTALLRHSIPKDMASKGLRDWETGGQVEELEVRKLTTPTSTADFVRQRQARKASRDAMAALRKEPGAAKNEREVALKKTSIQQLRDWMDKPEAPAP
ncbi:hypothetical protein B0H63DRAFT_310512 [Podospora didyma]|uniref:Uncharacterized protein n=1 Tax=Podospora didyma TaxID=330526 RepID=A0AAE0K678_9PEZI|nr:hypothetical protein B0H63DRAFT_310512 [Podospora didyma]